VNQERPPRVGLKMLLRGGLAALLIVCVSATAVAVAVIREVEDIIAPLQGRATIEIPELDRADAGGARTFLILGSDKRKGVDRDSPPRSDTMLLVRADPDKDAITVLSVPRDLRVEIPGFGEDKINAAYEYGARRGRGVEGSARLATRTLKQLFRDATGENFPITNVLVMDYGAFRRAVDYIDGVYVDVDRDYFNDNSSGQNYATIDVDPGYQLLRGRDALDYVRYRHTDNDFVRAARQQDFLRQAQNDSDARRLLSLGESRRLVRIFSRYFETDDSLSSTKEVFSLLKLMLFLAGQNPKVNEVRFRAREAENPQVDSNLYVSTGALRVMYREFMSTEGSATPRRSSKATEADREARRVRGKRRRERGPVPGLENSRAEGENMAVLADPKLKLPFYFPRVRLTGSAYEGTEPRLYKVRDEKGRRHEAYRLVLRAPGIGEYYGIQGLTWKTPPILDNPDREIERRGRELKLYYDGSSLRLVAWRTKRGVYWLSNTLSQKLSEEQMLSIAGSLRRLNQ
jgi:polyisoprenyl-teichoic acid--peptidoglycan teichoic acid transferase